MITKQDFIKAIHNASRQADYLHCFKEDDRAEEIMFEAVLWCVENGISDDQIASMKSDWQCEYFFKHYLEEAREIHAHNMNDEFLVEKFLDEMCEGYVSNEI